VSDLGGQFAAVPVWFIRSGNCKPMDTHILCVIHSFAGPSGRIYPSYQTIADIAGVSKRTVELTVRRLVEMKVLQKAARTDARGAATSNCYSVQFQDPHWRSEDEDTPANQASPPSEPGFATPANQASLPQRTRLRPKPDPIKPDLSTDVDSPNVASDVELAFAAYNQAADQADWPKARKPTKRRVSQLKARLADVGGLDKWRAALRRAVGNPFFAGDNDRGWKADLDFFLQEKSFTKLIEGSYDRKPPSGARATNSRPSGPHAQLFEAAARVADREQRGEL